MISKKQNNLRQKSKEQNTTEQQECKCCGSCAYFYDEWFDGTGLCAKANGGVTQCDHGTTCKAYAEREYTTEDSDDDLPW